MVAAGRRRGGGGRGWPTPTPTLLLLKAKLPLERSKCCCCCCPPPPALCTCLPGRVLAEGEAEEATPAAGMTVPAAAVPGRRVREEYIRGETEEGGRRSLGSPRGKQTGRQERHCKKDSN